MTWVAGMRRVRMQAHSASRARTCGHVAVYFSYFYPTRDGKIAYSLQTVLSRCVGGSRSEPPHAELQPEPSPIETGMHFGMTSPTAPPRHPPPPAPPGAISLAR